MDNPRIQGMTQTLCLNGPPDGAVRFKSILFSRTDRFSFATPDGRLVTRHYSLDGTGLRIGRVTSTGHRVTLTEDDNVSVLLPRKGGLTLEVAGHVHDLRAGQVALMPPQTRQTSARPDAPGRFVGDVMMLPRHALSALSREIEVTLPDADFLRLHGSAPGRLADDLAVMLAGLARHRGAPDHMAALLRDLLAECLVAVGADAQPGGKGCGIERERVQRAVDIIRARAHEHLSTADLAGELGIGLRSLQLAFQRVHAESPRAYLARVRLGLVRARLLAADPARDGVTAIALDCGFTHLGRFAGAYRAVYRETPHETLLARRRPVV